MYAYLEKGGYFAQISEGMEALGAQELTELGAKHVKPAFRGIYFYADKKALYRINYSGRMISRVLAPIKRFYCKSTDELYRCAKQINWPRFFNTDETFAVFANVSNSDIRHSKYAALRLKDAIADRFRDRFNCRPNVKTLNPDLWINLYIEKNQAVISLDTSGGSLHRRGYRKKTGDAPMQETLAAAILELTKWNGESPLYDPMCGSGTLLCEALMKYSRIPPGYFRKKFGFEHLPDFDNAIWQSVKRTANARIQKLSPKLIYGSDIDNDAVACARTNVKGIKGGKNVSIMRMDYQDIDALEDHLIICNPPYGLRLEKNTDMAGLYKRLGDFLKKRCKGSTAYIYFGKREMIKKIGLRTTWKKPLKNGGLDGRLARYDLY